MAIVIDIGAQADLAVFTQLASALKGVQGGLSGVTSQARQATQAAAGGGGFMQAIVGTRPPVQGPTPLQQFQFLNAANRVTGGQFRQQAGQAAATGWNFYSQRFQQTGDPRALAAMNQLSGHLARQNQAGALSTFIRSTRFNMGGVSPLVGRTMDAVSALGPRFASLAGPIGIATMAFTAVAASAMSAKDQLQAFTSGMLEAGTSVGTYAQMQRAGSLLGGDMAGRAQQFQAAIERGGIAQYQALQAGINPLGGPFGDRDVGAKLMRALEDVARSGSLEEARRKAMNYGQADMARSFLLSDEAKRHMFSGANAPTQASLAQAEEFSFWLEEAKRTGMEFVRVVGTPFLRTLSKATQFFVSLQARINAFFDSPVGRVIVAGLGGIAATFGNGGKQVETAMERNTSAIRENTRALKDTREILGGGARAQRALPTRVRGHFLNDRAYRQGLATGLL